MSRRTLLFATLGVLCLAAAGCGGGGSGGGPQDGGPQRDAAIPDADVPPDAPPDGDTVPDTTITAGPTGDVATGASLTYTFTSVGGTSFECRVDGGTFAACTSPHTITAGSGAHSFAVRARDDDGDVDPSPAVRVFNGIGSNVKVRLMAGNLTSGNDQAYEAPGIRIFQGLKPDIALVQEFNVGDNQPATIRDWVDTTFGPAFFFFRESGAQIPNGIVSRFPILESGLWEDPEAPNREFAFARIDVPGPIDLWAVSVHLLTDDGRRDAEAVALVGFIKTFVPDGDYLVVGGDFNSDSRTEDAILTLGEVVGVAAPFPVDQAGTSGTNSSRRSPFDWVMVDDQVDALRVPVVIGANSFPNGLVFDSRVYTPLTDVAPVLMTDSAAVNMQHMGVVKDILIPSP